MRIARRVLTVTVAFPLWIVMILIGGQWCLMPGSASAHPVVSSAIGGHAMAMLELHDDQQEMGAGMSHEQTPLATGASHRSGDDAAPANPGNGDRGQACASQAACSVAIAPAALQLTASGGFPHWRHQTLTRERPASHAPAPELPPPRA